MTSISNSLDPTDLRILEVIQNDADQSADAIGDLVHLSPSAVQRRIVRMKKAGIIERVAAIVNPKAVQRGFTVIVQIELETERLDAVEPFRRWIRAQDVVQSCWYVTGETDYLLIVVVRNLEEYTDFTDRLMTARLSVRRFRSSVSLMTIKRTLNLSLGELMDD